MSNAFIARSPTLTIVIGEPTWGEMEWRDNQSEINELATSAGCDVLATQRVKLRQPHAATFLRQGAIAASQKMIDVVKLKRVILSCDIGITQTLNLEKIWGCTVIDRTALILKIFSRRAKSHEGKLQVKLAYYRREMGRLTGLWKHLERQRGGIGLFSGPGEKQLELDRRLLEEKIKRLEKKALKIEMNTNLVQRKRKKSGMITVALVGYTNAGKSSLFNILAGETQPTRNRLFDTLDTVTRKVYMSDDDSYILSDSVGFIRRLPHELIAGFRTTLKDTVESDVLIILVDSSQLDWKQKLNCVKDQLDEIGTKDKPKIIVMNKIDQSGERARVRRSECGRITKVYLSCKTKEGVLLLKQSLSEIFQDIKKSRFLLYHFPTF